MVEQEAAESNFTLATNTAKIMVAQGLGVLAALGFDIAIASTYGATLETDAVLAALTIPQIIGSVIMSISVRVFTPVFTEAQETGGKVKLANTFSGIINLNFLFWTLVAIICFLGAGLIIFIQSPGFTSEARSLAVPAFRILILNFILVGVREPFRAYLIYLDRAILASLGFFLRFGASLVFLLLMKEILGILAISWAYVIGSLFELLVFILAFFLSGGAYRFTLGLKNNTLNIMTSRFAPILITELIAQSSVFIERIFASFLPPGSLTALTFGRRALLALNRLINQSVSLAFLRRLTLESVTGNLSKLRASMNFSSQFLTIVTSFSALLLIGLSTSIVRILFERGAFGTIASTTTAIILTIFAPSIVFMGITQLYRVPFFAFGETRVIMTYRILALLLNIGLDIVLIREYGAFGLAAAFTISTLFEAVLWSRRLSRRIGPFWVNFKIFFLKLIGIIFLIGVFVFWTSKYLEEISNSLVLFLMVVLVSLVATFLFALLGLVTQLVPVKGLLKNIRGWKR